MPMKWDLPWRLLNLVSAAASASFADFCKRKRESQQHNPQFVRKILPTQINTLHTSSTVRQYEHTVMTNNLICKQHSVMLTRIRIYFIFFLFEHMFPLFGSTRPFVLPYLVDTFLTQFLCPYIFFLGCYFP